MWTKPLRSAVLVVFAAGLAQVATAGTKDRDYLFGDDTGEAGMVGAPVGVDFGGTLFTYDSAGQPNNNELHDLAVNGNPVYANVSSRPNYSGGVGVALDGSGDFFVGANLNFPETSIASVNYDDCPEIACVPGPFNYVGISNRYFQLWVNPNSASQGVAQTVVMDSNQHGVRIVDGKWSMRYGGQNYASTTDVAFDEWSHVLLTRPNGPDNGSALYVNGIAVAAGPGGYDGTATEELVVGSNTARDGDRNFIGGTEEYFHGLLDNLSLSVVGDNTAAGGQDWGDFDIVSDSEFLAPILGGAAAADVNLDGSVGGDGTGPAATDDVTAFVEGWLFVREINGVRAADLETRQNGDLNLDGITSLPDWAILNAANPQLGAAVAHQLFGVPEPGSCLLAGWVGLLLLQRIRGCSTAR